MRSGHHYSTFQDIWKKKLQNKQNKISKHSHKNEGKQQRHTGNDNKDKVLLGDTQHELKKMRDGHRRSYRTAALTHDGNANYTEREPVVTATVKCEMGVAPQRLWSPLVRRRILGGDQMQPGWVQHIGHRDLPGPTPLLTPPLSLAFAIGTGCMWFPWGGGAWVRGFYWCVRQKLLQKKKNNKKKRWKSNGGCGRWSRGSLATTATRTMTRRCSSYLAVVCQRIPPGWVLRALTIPLLRGLGKVQLLTGWRWRGKGRGWGGKRATMKPTHTCACVRAARSIFKQRCKRRQCGWVRIRSQHVAVFAVL